MFVVVYTKRQYLTACSFALSIRPDQIDMMARPTLSFSQMQTKKKCDPGILISVFGFPSAHGENINKQMSKQLRSLTCDYILSKHFNYYLTKKVKILVVFFYPLLIKIKQVFLSFSNRLATLKLQCFDT